MIIDGKKLSAPTGFEVTNPATGAVIGYAPNGQSKDLDAAVDSAARAFKTWSLITDEARCAAIRAVSAKLEEHAEELAQLMTAEQGKPLNGIGSRFEVGLLKDWAEHTASTKLPVKVIQDDETGKVELHRKPLGVIGSITPWNFPLAIAIWHVLPAIRTGNTVVLKPSPHTPLATLRMVELMNEVLPAGVINCVTCDDKSSNLGAEMSVHRGIRKIILTGSNRTGAKVMSSAADTMKRLTLELGGNDAAIVLPDVDAKAIAEGLFFGAFFNNGQACAAIKRLYVHEDVYDEVCDALAEFAGNIKTGPGTDEDSILGPLANQMQFDIVSRLVEEGAKEGRVLTGGAPGEGLFYPVTLIADLNDDNPLVQSEQFGPVLPIIKYSDIDAAIEMANRNENGLGGSIWSSDVEKARQLALRLETGTGWVNQHGMLRPDVPFGGRKKSGLGVEFGEEGLASYTDIQAVVS
ncbi:aldehyde dehydrogenase family protein [Phaeobacter sp. HF9A]|nr:aldehyde dehydrogenase family protein [Phaeobacter sp. HF9A]